MKLTIKTNKKHFHEIKQLLTLEYVTILFIDPSKRYIIFFQVYKSRYQPIQKSIIV